jgi:hypothetical protein
VRVALFGRWKENTFVVESALLSYEASPIRPVRRLSSTKRRTEVRSVAVWSTKFAVPHVRAPASSWENR